MRLIAFVTEIGSIRRILAYLGEPTKAPLIAPAARGAPDWEGDCDTREGDTFVRSESLPEYEFDQRVSWFRRLPTLHRLADQGHWTGTGGLASAQKNCHLCVPTAPWNPARTTQTTSSRSRAERQITGQPIRRNIADALHGALYETRL